MGWKPAVPLVAEVPVFEYIDECVNLLHSLELYKYV